MMYHQLTSQQRYTIFVLRQKNVAIKDIADTIGVHYSTVYRELKRNKGTHHYHYGIAQHKCDERKHRMRRHRKFSIDMRKRIVSLLVCEQWSPEQIKGWMERNGEKCVSVETIYQYIRFDRKCGGELYKHCRHRLKNIRRTAQTAHTAIKDRVMIEQREEEADGTRFGDFEMDTIIGKDGKGAIVTIVERSRDFFMMRKLRHGKNAKQLAKTVVAMMTPYIGRIKSITTDNGSEFAEHKYIAERLKTKIFFTHPYSSWEKGNIENTNKLIRQYIPKGTDFKHISEEQIKRIQHKINRRPRKKLNFSTPTAEFFKKIT